MSTALDRPGLDRPTLLPRRALALRALPTPTLAALLLVVTAAPALAQSQGIVSLPPVGPGESRLLIGGAALAQPSYAGSSQHRYRVLPYLDYARRDGFYASVTNGLGYSFIQGPALQAGLRLIPQFGRDENDSPALRGMGDIGTGLEASAYWTMALTRQWTVGAQVRGGSRGAEFDAGVRRDFMLGPATRLSATTFLTAANRKSQQTFFGVDALQAARSGYAVYEPGAGARNLQFSLTANHFFAGRWIAIGGVGAGRLLGGAADSPLVREKTQVGGFVAIGYQVF